MAKILQYGKNFEEVTYSREFVTLDDQGNETGAGFSFPCDCRGQVDVVGLQPAGAENWRRCSRGEISVLDKGVVAHRRNVYHAPIIECDGCGNSVQLDNAATNTCDRCGALYNGSGQRLSDPRDWGEETGEHWADVWNALGGGS
jgi:hypothetical protein